MPSPETAADLSPEPVAVEPRRTPTRVLAPPPPPPGPLGSAEIDAAEASEEGAATEADASPGVPGESGLIIAGPGPALAEEASPAASMPPPLPDETPLPHLPHLRLAEALEPSADTDADAGLDVVPLEDASADISLVPVPPEVRRAASALAEAQSEPRRPSRARSRPPSRTAGSSGRAFGTLPPKETPPPSPSSEALYRSLDDWTPPLRREESVIAEAAALRSAPWQRVSRSVKAALQVAGPYGVQAATAIGEASMQLMRRFERLPRRAQIAWVAAPYLGAMVLLVLLWTSGDEPLPAEAPPPAEAAVAAAVPTPAAVPEPVAPTPAEVEAPPAATAATAEVVPKTAPESAKTGAGATTVSAETHVLGRKSALYLRPSTRYKRAARLRKGHALTVYRAVPAPKGWALAVSEKGTVGYVLERHLR